MKTSLIATLVAIPVGALIGLLMADGGLIGQLIGNHRWMGFLFGGLFGLLLAQVVFLRKRLASLEQRLNAHSASSIATEPARPRTIDRAGRPTPQAESAVATGPQSQAHQSDPAASTPRADTSTAQHQTAPSARTRAKPAAKPAWLTGLGSNLPVKIGVLMSLIAVAALLRYLSEQGWLTLPLAARLALVGLGGLALLTLGWRERVHRRTFGLSLQGGGIGILILTLFASERLYGLIPTLPAFLLISLVVAGAAILAVGQRSLALAVLALLAGFAAPPALGTGEGPPLVLFSWYLVLNVGVFAISLFRRWPLLNRLALLFTFVIAGLWGVLAWDPRHQGMAQTFLAAYFLLFFLIPLVEGRAGRSGSPILNVLLLFGLPLLAIPLQIALLPDQPIAIALILLGAAGLYLAAALWLSRQADMATLSAIHAVLAVGLATLAIPFAFSGPVIAAVWAIEGAALVWLGCRQNQRLPRLAGLGLQLLAAPTWLASYWFSNDDGMQFLNPVFLGAAAISLAALVSSRSYWRAGVHPNSPRLWLLIFWGALFWLLAFNSEVIELTRLYRTDAWVAIAALTLALLAFVLPRLPLSPLRAVAALVPLLALISVVELPATDFLFGRPGSVAWLFFVGTLLLLDARMARSSNIWRAILSLLGHLAVLLALAHVGIHMLLRSDINNHGWLGLVYTAPFLLTAGWLLVQQRPPLAWASPSADNHRLLCMGLLILLALGWLTSLPQAGGSAPLPWLPVINPLELTQVASLLLLTLLARRVNWPRPTAIVSLAALITASLATLRSVHQLTEVPWTAPALWQSPVAQSSLSILWTVVAVATWLLGSRRRHYGLWLVGVTLMGIVLLKLLLIDRSFLGNIAGILSFLAFGLLSMAIGYLAPAPPTNKAPSESSS